MRGQVLTIDAMIATITAIAMIAVISGMLSSINTGNYNEQQMAATGHDLLSVMHINGTLNRYIGKSTAFVNASLQQEIGMLPASYCSNITVKIYRAEDFQLTDTYGARTNCIASSSTTRVKRIFADYNNAKFGVAEMNIWLRT